jgi:hypothetical protein
LAIGVAVTLQAGPLTPPPAAVSGGAPTSTMKTLEQVTPTWDRVLPANDTSDPCNSTRFTCVMGGTAVRDNETGLVWERSPSTTGGNWLNALSECIGREVGNRPGWRLPTIQELMSLTDPTVASPGPTLPPGHPFNNVQSLYWSATASASNSSVALNVSFNDADDGGGLKTDIARIWCVRGGKGAEVQ